jgi:endonuclease/exonuclease/phosphatase family metal-dependent hydrolase
MNKIIVLFAICLCLGATSFAQTTGVTLSGTQYLQNFDNIGTALPAGWGIKTGAISNTVLGADAALTTAPTLWNVTSGRFNNFASAEIGASGDQNAATNRALGIRQTGTVGDPGAAFVVKLANTTGFTALNLSFKLQSLDVTSTRTTLWLVEYGIGETPTSFTSVSSIPTTLPTGNSLFSNQTVTASLGSALDNVSSPVWIRIRTNVASTGTGNRPSTAIDDFILTYAGASNTPTINITADSIKGFLTNQGTTSPSKSYIVSANKLTNNLVLTAPAGFEISTNAITGYATSVTIPQIQGTIASTTIYVRLVSTAIGNISGNITHVSAGTPSKSVYLEGKVNPAPVVSTIANAKTLADGRAVIISGRLTVKGEYGGKLVYIQDATGGLAVFANVLTSYPTWEIGDSVRIAGDMATFNGKREIIDPPSVIVVAGQVNKPILPKIITADKLSANEGFLVTVESMNFTTTGIFAFNTNYQAASCENIFVTVRINSSANPFSTKAIPTNTQTVTGVVELFNGAYQLLPRLVTDMATATKQCALSAVCNPQAVVIPTISTPRTASFDVVAWNLEWFGHTGAGLGPANDTLQQANIACVTSKLNADVMVFSEVCDTSKLSKILPVGYKYKCSTQYYSHFYDTPETAANPAQKVCVAYNTATVSPIDTACRAILTDKAVWTAASSNNSFWASGRLPYMFTANVTIEGVTQRLRVIGLHAKAGSAIADYNRRLEDVKALKTELDTKYPRDYVIVAGDFNDDVDVSITTGQPSTYADFVKDTANYKVITRELSDAGKRSTGGFPDVIDHIMVSNELTNTFITGSVGVADFNTMNFIGGYNATTTDHFPVWASFNLRRTGVTELKNGLGIKNVYPNPTPNYLNVEYASESDGSLEIRNTLGVTVFSKKVKYTEGGKTDRIEVGFLPTGMYFLTLSVKEGVSTKSFVKR